MEMAWLKKEKVYFIFLHPPYCEHLSHMTHSAVSNQKEEEEEAAPAVGDIPIRLPIPSELPHSLVRDQGGLALFLLPLLLLRGWGY